MTPLPSVPLTMFGVGPSTMVEPPVSELAPPLWMVKGWDARKSNSAGPKFEQPRLQIVITGSMTAGENVIVLTPVVAPPPKAMEPMFLGALPTVPPENVPTGVQVGNKPGGVGPVPV